MRRMLFIFLGAVIIGLLFIGAAAVWLVGTNHGARWLLSTVSSHTDMKVYSQEVEGRLLDHLRLKGVSVEVAQTKAEVDSLEIHWHLTGLLTGRLNIDRLILSGIRVTDDSPPGKEPVDLKWPRVSGFAQLLEVHIGSLQVHDLSYQKQGAEPVQVAFLSSTVDWSNSLLSLNGLRLDLPAGQVGGDIVAGFHRPSLQAALGLSLAKPVAGIDVASLTAKLSPGRGKEQLTGAISIAGSTGKRKLFELAGDFGVTRNSFLLRQVRVIQEEVQGLVTVGGVISLAPQEPLLDLQVEGAKVNLVRQLKVPTSLSGVITIIGKPDSYRGTLTLANREKGWHQGRIAGSYEGDRNGLKLAPLTGVLLDGTVNGNLNFDWRSGFSVSGELRGRNMNPAVVAADWKGVINADIAGRIGQSGKAPPAGEISGRLLDSSLHGQELSGSVQAAFSGTDVAIDTLNLRGRGFVLAAAGNLKQRLDVTARVAELSRLIPGAAGEFKADGWVRRRSGRLAGAASAQGRDVSIAGMGATTALLSLRMGDEDNATITAAVDLADFSYGQLRADRAQLHAAGRLAAHSVTLDLYSPDGEATVMATGGLSGRTWQGNVVQLSGHDMVGPWTLQQPASLTVSREHITLAPLILSGQGAERLQVGGQFSTDPGRGSFQGEWRALNLVRANAWLEDLQIMGASSGDITLQIIADDRIKVAGNATVEGTVTIDERRLSLLPSQLTINGGQQGISVNAELRLVEGGTLTGSLTSAKPARLAMPEEGKFALELAGVNLAMLRPWLPESATAVDGFLGGHAEGRILPGQRVEMNGTADLSHGKVRWHRGAGEMTANVRKAMVSWAWRGEALRGTADVVFAEYGQARSDFQLPVQARLPVVFDRQAPVQARVTGQVRELGIFSAFLPGLIQESHGEIDADVRIGGTFEDPLLTGVLQLVGAGAYVPSAGITIKDLLLTARLEKDQITIETFRAASGPGAITGSATLDLKGWEIAGYRGIINGDQFQLVYLPELQVLANPRLAFQGNPDKLTVTGEVHLPELLVLGPPARTVVKPSEDVVLEGAESPEAKAQQLALDVRVRVVLGDRVLVKAEGIDAQLRGALELSFDRFDRIASKGEIKVIKGNYRTYGVDLEIERGRLFYSGGPIDRPTLDILALRKVEEVRAGVTVAGTTKAPVVKLYSEPALPDVDILGYIVLGHPVGSGSSGEQAGIMALAAGALLSTGQSVVLQDQIKQRLGLSTLEIGTVGEQSRLMGYKEIPVAPAGQASSKQAASVSRTMLTVGKYLTPQLYISYGRSLFTGANLFRVRYDISKRLQVQTETGTESGADIYYKMEFN